MLSLGSSKVMPSASKRDEKSNAIFEGKKINRHAPSPSYIADSVESINRAMSSFSLETRRRSITRKVEEIFFSRSARIDEFCSLFALKRSSMRITSLPVMMRV